MENLYKSSIQKKIIRSFFNRTCERWDNLYDGTTFINEHMRDRKRIVLESVEEYAKGRKLKILDLGCGSGILTMELLKKGHTVVGADIAGDLISKLNSTLKTHTGIDYLGSVTCDVGATSFAGESFDVILCIGVLQYQLDDNSVLKEITRTMNRDGICIITFPNLFKLDFLFDPAYYFKFVFRLIKRFFVFKKTRLSGRFQHNYPYDKKYYLGSIRKMISENALCLIKTAGFGYGPFTFFNRSIFSNRLSIKISDAIDRLAFMSGINIFNYVSNRWVCVAKKSG